jgi:hypothetical protein
MPGARPDTRIKPLPLINGHGRYNIDRYTRTRTDTSPGNGRCTLYSRYNFVTVYIPKRPRNGYLDPEVV